MQAAAEAICFGNARLEIDRRRLLIDGKPAKLGARAFDVLLALIQRRDRTVSKDELLEVVWRDTVVEENNLQVHTSALRKLLGPEAIATIPGRGYRFTAQIDGSPIKPDAMAPPETRSRPALDEPEPLYGREDDLAALHGLLQQHRLVSIVGAGGIGKTRLARALCRTEREHFDGGIWWVDLSQLSDAAAVPAAIAQALGVRDNNDRPVLQTVSALLRNGRSLLILDNCEHVLDAAADCVRTLLAGALDSRVLTTSQEPLRLPAEQVYRLSGLAAEDKAGTPAAVALFVTRARAADPRLQPTSPQLATIADICRRLDGVPLAIELAAARVRLLGVDGVRARLDERFSVLTGGTRSVLRRHQTLRATLEWSHQLLSVEERTVFRRLGVFVGGFSLGLAQAVVADEHLDQWAVLDLLGHLVDKSLVVADGGEVPRYRLLETTRAFALEQLATTGETAPLLRRHADALLKFVQHVEAGNWTWSLEEQKRHGAELDNLRAALEWTVASAETRELACALFANSRRLWLTRDLLNEGIGWGKRLLPLPDGLEVESQARFKLALAELGYFAGPRECFVAALQGTELFRSLGDTARLIDCLTFTALVGARHGESQRSATAIAEADALIDENAPLRQQATLALAHARHFAYLGDYEKAVAGAERQAAFHRQAGNLSGEQFGLSAVAWFGGLLGGINEAIPALERALAELRRMDAPYGIGNTERFLTCAYAVHGDREAALATGRAMIPYLRRAQSVTTTVPYIALLHAQQPGSEAMAAALIGFFDNDLTRTGLRVPPFVLEVRERVMTLAKAALGDAQASVRAAAGAQLTEEQAIDLMFNPGSD